MSLEVYPYQILDGGAVVLRARLTANLAPLLGDAASSVGSLIVRTVMVDLFDPPQRVAFRERVVALRTQGSTEKAAAKELGLTITAAQRAMALHRKMQETGATDPYRLLLNPPEDDGRFSRHNHLRYCFQSIKPSEEITREAI